MPDALPPKTLDKSGWRVDDAEIVGEAPGHATERPVRGGGRRRRRGGREPARGACEQLVAPAEQLWPVPLGVVARGADAVVAQQRRWCMAAKLRARWRAERMAAYGAGGEQARVSARARARGSRGARAARTCTMSTAELTRA